MGNIFSTLEPTLQVTKGGGLGMAARAGAGAAVGAFGGPIGAGLGAGIGAGVGLLLGLASGLIAIEYVITRYKNLKGGLRRLAEFLLIIKTGPSVPAKIPPMPDV